MRLLSGHEFPTRFEVGDPICSRYRVRVWLNGVELDKVVVADELRREVERLSPGPHGDYLGADGNVLTEQLHGEVRTVLEEWS